MNDKMIIKKPPAMFPVIAKCAGCVNIVDQKTCRVFQFPESKWRNEKNCPMATHLVKEVKEEKRVDPIKLSKLKAKGKV